MNKYRIIKYKDRVFRIQRRKWYSVLWHGYIAHSEYFVRFENADDWGGSVQDFDGFDQAMEVLREIKKPRTPIEVVVWP